VRRGGLPRAAGRQTDWTTAWRPDPTEEATRERAVCPERTHGVVTARWPLAQRWGGAAGPRAPADKVSWELWCEHRGGGDNAPDEVAAAMAHPSSGLTCGGRAEAAQRCPTLAEVLRDGWHRWCGPALSEEKGEGEAHAN
jgi:hypothetical protein